MTKDSKNAEGQKGDKSPVSVDVGLSAKASFDVSTEIPSEVSGGLVSALTDIIRPFTEDRGLKADRIRLQRMDVAIQIAQKARQIAEIENLPLNPVPTKLMVPFLEKASTEEPEDETMQARWAALLLSASKSYQAKHLTFVDILSRLSADELKVLEETCFAYKGFPETAYPNAHADWNAQLILEQAHNLKSPAPGKEKAAYDAFIAAASFAYGGHIHASVLRQDGGSVWFYTEYRPGGPKYTSLEILQRERLIDIRRFEMDTELGRFCKLDVGYFEMTWLGISFVMACSPDAAKMAARRPPPVQLKPVSPEQSAKIVEMLRKAEADKK
jgi:hypothetical protein